MLDGVIFLFLFMSDIYVFKSKRDENMQDNTKDFFGALGFLFIDEKVYLVSQSFSLKNIKNMNPHKFPVFFLIKKNHKS